MTTEPKNKQNETSRRFSMPFVVISYEWVRGEAVRRFESAYNSEVSIIRDKEFKKDVKNILMFYLNEILLERGASSGSEKMIVHMDNRTVESPELVFMANFVKDHFSCIEEGCSFEEFEGRLSTDQKLQETVFLIYRGSKRNMKRFRKALEKHFENISDERKHSMLLRFSTK